MQDAVVAGPVAAPSDEAQDDAAADGLSLSARAKNLLEEHKQVFEKLSRMQDAFTVKANPAGQVPALVPRCLLCNAQKHRCLWEYRRNNRSKRVVTGGSCYSCCRTAVLLKCSRGPLLLKESGALAPFVSLSACVRDSLGEADICTCHACK